MGSNIDARSNISSGIDALRKKFYRVDLSPVYQTTAFGFEGEDFINLVAQINTGMAPLELKKFLNDLEDQHQRNRDAPRYSDRTLDIDILLYDDLYLMSPELNIPRGEVMTAAHVLKPLADLAPDLLHPVCRKPISEIWDEFPEKDSHLELIDL